uniref:Uncharacterized protein n=1 Tax=Cucumis melo TaxID=3656 RepID=A0A9I9DX31_CUCME
MSYHNPSSSSLFDLVVAVAPPPFTVLHHRSSTSSTAGCSTTQDAQLHRPISFVCFHSPFKLYLHTPQSAPSSFHLHQLAVFCIFPPTVSAFFFVNI